MTSNISIVTTLLVFLFATGTDADPGVTTSLQRNFDSLGPTVSQLQLKDGRVVHFIDDGEVGWRPVVLTGGLGTSVRVIRLLDFLRTTRENLRLRFITVERNGFGQTGFDAELGMEDFSTDVEAVLSHLGIEKFSLFGISGGGPYTAKIASRNVSRLVSVHMAATSPLLSKKLNCSEDNAASGYRQLLAYPMRFFGFPAESPVHRVSGLQDTAFDEAARAHNLRGQRADPAALDHEIQLYCDEGEIDTSDVSVPVFVYRGLSDAVLGSEPLSVWKQAFPRAKLTIRAYAGEGHDVQYRHLDQILLDMAGPGDGILVCSNDSPMMVPPTDVSAIIDSGGHLGLCAWEQ